MYRIGQGFDVHALKPGREIILGGVRISHDKTLEAHSDGDVVLHALCDAILGALALGDIGQHFPPSDPLYRDCDSQLFVLKVFEMCEAQGYGIHNVDVTVLAEQPKLLPHIPKMREVIAKLLQCSDQAISIKATTTEKLGFVGREEGIAAQAVVLLQSSGR